jgi:hypothetical protein
MTFVLETADAGLGPSLMMLWTLYGLAKKQGRGFFIDDTRWAYGRYTDIFGTPPAPDCRPPPRHEMLPCPSQALHLVVSAATAKDLFGPELDITEADSESERSITPRDLFDLARHGYLALYQLVDEDRKYVHARVQNLLKRTGTSHHPGGEELRVGIHMRRGDVHPYEFQYRDSYIPTSVYLEKAQELVNNYHNRTGHGENGAASPKQGSLVIVASDDPTVYETHELVGTLRAQEQIRLASKSAIQQANPDRNTIHRFLDETFGWEGGFFAAMFWSLGVSSMNAGNAIAASLEEKTRLAPSAETLRLRTLIGRAYMMDLAVLAGASDTVICTVSAMGCRLLAVMMGWEAAFESGNWVNIDGSYGWAGIA